jgi:RNA polymerase sigma factor (sigma-70 family)
VIAGILLGIVAGLLANEFCELSPWCARKLVRWSAFRRYADPDRAKMRAEELTSVINDRPGNLFKLITAVSFASAAVIVGTRRAVAREADAVSAPASTGWSADRAVSELYSRHYVSLVRVAASLVPDTPTAEGMVQDSFVAMHRRWQSLRSSEKALAYLYQDVENRSRATVNKNLQKTPPDMLSAEDGALDLLERSAVISALRDLPGQQRQAITLRLYADLSEAEIADVMNISRRTVKSHRARGMATLRAALESADDRRG